MTRSSHPRPPLLVSFLLLVTIGGPGRLAADNAAPTNPPPLPLLAPVTTSAQPINASSDQVSFSLNGEGAAQGIDVAINPGPANYPGITIKPPTGAVWDLSTYGHVEAQVTNTGENPVKVTLRVDNAGDWQESPYNASSTYALAPGESKPLSVIFGFSFNHPAYALNPAAVTQILIFTGKTDVPLKFRIGLLQAAGAKVAVPPVPLKIKPPNGVILGTGGIPDSDRTIVAENGAQGTFSADGQALQIAFAGGSEQIVRLKPKPALNFWSLADDDQVRIKFKNDGPTPVTPAVRIESHDGPTERVTAATPLPPGAEGEIVVPFAPRVPAQGVATNPGKFWGMQPGTGTKFSSNEVTGISILCDATPGAKNLEVTSITGEVSPPSPLPDGLGKHPPEAGDWKMTFDEEFNGTTVDLTKWNIYTINYWDKRAHFTKDDAIVRDGMLHLHFEKKTGHDWDDPARPETDYATGNLDTGGKWAQRYGYFEARMKLPHAPGLWPAFWLYPEDVPSGTKNGGMEFDIMEFISGWGLYRYNIAMHWGGYAENHHQIGSTCNYVQPDRDGFITSGLLWTPGQAIYYANGKEILRWESPLVGNQPANIILDLVSGRWDHVNEPLDDAKLSDDFVVDYVRVWQRGDLASAVYGPKPNAGTPAKPGK